jgi:hypothetical protein
MVESREAKGKIKEYNNLLMQGKKKTERENESLQIPCSRKRPVCGSFDLLRKTGDWKEARHWISQCNHAHARPASLTALVIPMVVPCF